MELLIMKSIFYILFIYFVASCGQKHSDERSMGIDEVEDSIEIIEYHKKDSLKIQRRYFVSNGVLNGLYTEFDLRGISTREILFHKGRGVGVRYYYGTNKPEFIEQCVQDTIDNKIVVDGLNFHLHSNGTLLDITRFKLGWRNGNSFSFNNEEQLIWAGQYFQSAEDSIWRKYDNRGDLVERFNYIKGTEIAR